MGKDEQLSSHLALYLRAAAAPRARIVIDPRGANEVASKLSTSPMDRTTKGSTVLSASREGIEYLIKGRVGSTEGGVVGRATGTLTHAPLEHMAGRIPSAIVSLGPWAPRMAHRVYDTTRIKDSDGAQRAGDVIPPPPSRDARATRAVPGKPFLFTVHIHLRRVIPPAFFDMKHLCYPAACKLLAM
ncbi:hypothetical protein EVAR_7986_1 [Eumeta japonica]|uniref:Uncharacterized protein n=1 Tax=Eumeta variegata TaxID=151549 RepID=A0A4C1TGX3_EUMVA|nr:hypothetical protein EVAR_7986_1 [Eumeta japonica]